MFNDLDTRELLRVRSNPLTLDQARRLRGSRPAGPPPRPSVEPIRVQRRASNTGVIMVCGQEVALGRAYKHQAVCVLVSETTLAIELPDSDTQMCAAPPQPVRSIKRPAATDRYLIFLGYMSHISWRTCVEDQLSDHTASAPWLSVERSAGLLAWCDGMRVVGPVPVGGGGSIRLVASAQRGSRPARARMA